MGPIFWPSEKLLTPVGKAAPASRLNSCGATSDAAEAPAVRPAARSNAIPIFMMPGIFIRAPLYSLSDGYHHRISATQDATAGAKIAELTIGIQNQCARLVRKYTQRDQRAGPAGACVRPEEARLCG